MTFLSEDALLVADAGHNSSPFLRLFRLPQAFAKPPENFSVLTELEFCVVMGFPRSDPVMFFGSEIGCRSYPLPKGRQWRPSAFQEEDNPYEVPNQDIVFRTSDEDRIITVDWTYDLNTDPEGPTDGMWEESQLVFTHVSSLLSFMDKAKGEEGMVVPWEEWSHLARLLEERPRRSWYSPTYGQRYVLSTSRHNYSTVVLDFNQHAIKKDLASSSSRNSEGDRDVLDIIATGERRLINHGTYASSMIYNTKPLSSLPYTEVCSKVVHKSSFEGLMLVRL